MNKNFCLLILFFSLISVNGTSKRKKKHLLKDTSCYKLKFGNECKLIPKLKDTKNIFFIESSCSGRLNSRQACSVESAARANPQWKIFVLYIGPFVEKFKKGDTLKTLKSYTNVRFHRVNLTQYTENTLLEHLFEEEIYRASRFAVVYCSDILRVLTLQKYGGVYLDLDMIVQRPFDDLPKDFVGKEHALSIDNKLVGSAVIGLSKSKIGRKFADMVLREISDDFIPLSYTEHTNKLYTKTLRKICNTRNIYMMNKNTCKGFHVMDNQYFFPLKPAEFRTYFANDTDLLLSEFNDTYAFHIWNSYSRLVAPGSGSFFVQLAKKLCPKVYSLYKNDFGGVKNNKNIR